MQLDLHCPSNKRRGLLSRLERDLHLFSQLFQIVNIVLQGFEEEIECNVGCLATLAFSHFLTLLNQRVHLPLNFTEWNVVIEDVSHLLNDTLFKDIQHTSLKFTVTPTDLQGYNITLTYLLHELRIVEPNCVKKVLRGINYVLLF
ncbi:uncharacterized protein [Cicer arietinum]|uniref:uncharacterized protein isoform X2 n=1 Tax=Cicer arietinum TaxID=3827 RepID=UPI003CC51E41